MRQAGSSVNILFRAPELRERLGDRAALVFFLMLSSTLRFPMRSPSGSNLYKLVVGVDDSAVDRYWAQAKLPHRRRRTHPGALLRLRAQHQHRKRRRPGREARHHAQQLGRARAARQVRHRAQADSRGPERGQPQPPAHPAQAGAARNHLNGRRASGPVRRWHSGWRAAAYSGSSMPRRSTSGCATARRPSSRTPMRRCAPASRTPTGARQRARLLRRARVVGRQHFHTRPVRPRVRPGFSAVPPDRRPGCVAAVRVEVGRAGHTAGRSVRGSRCGDRCRTAPAVRRGPRHLSACSCRTLPTASWTGVGDTTAGPCGHRAS